MDVHLICPHVAPVGGAKNVVDGIVRGQAPTEGIAIGGKGGVEAIEEKRQAFEDVHLIILETIYHALLATSHLVDQVFGGDGQAFAMQHTFDHGKVQLLGNERVGHIEFVPVEATFLQAVGQEFLPGELMGKGGEEGHIFIEVIGSYRELMGVNGRYFRLVDIGTQRTFVR